MHGERNWYLGRVSNSCSNGSLWKVCNPSDHNRAIGAWDISVNIRTGGRVANLRLVVLGLRHVDLCHL